MWEVSDELPVIACQPHEDLTSSTFLGTCYLQGGHCSRSLKDKGHHGMGSF